MRTWTKVAAPRLSDGRCVALHERLLLLGGFGQTSSTGLRLHEAPLVPGAASSAELKWTALPSGPPTDRGGHAAAALAGNDSSGPVAVLHGGYGHGAEYQGNLGDLWMMKVRREAGPFLCRSDAYLLAPFLTNNSPRILALILSTTALKGDKWRKCTPGGTAPSARAGHSLSPLRRPTAKSRHTGEECVIYGGFGDYALDDVHLLQPGTVAGDDGVWLQPRVLGESPGARCAHSAVATRCGGVVIFGGHSAYGADAALSLLEVSTPLAEKESSRLGVRTVLWTPLYAAPPEGDEDPDAGQLARSGHSAVLVSRDRMLVIGGTRSDGSHHSDALGDVLCLDLSEEGLERARHPDGGARWERWPLARGSVGGGGNAGLPPEDEFARYNHACAVLSGTAAPGEEEKETVLVFGGNDANHEARGDGLSIRVPG